MYENTASLTEIARPQFVAALVEWLNTNQPDFYFEGKRYRNDEINLATAELVEVGRVIEIEGDPYRWELSVGEKHELLIATIFVGIGNYITFADAIDPAAYDTRLVVGRKRDGSLEIVEHLPKSKAGVATRRFETVERSRVLGIGITAHAAATMKDQTLAMRRS